MASLSEAVEAALLKEVNLVLVGYVICSDGQFMGATGGWQRAGEFGKQPKVYKSIGIAKGVLKQKIKRAEKANEFWGSRDINQLTKLKNAVILGYYVDMRFEY